MKAQYPDAIDNFQLPLSRRSGDYQSCWRRFPAVNTESQYNRLEFLSDNGI
jgi:hypothetical protein